ncbi:MAG: hypothetical protein LBI06_05245, partial [Treponema sp.]|nr:hypothetical protein [Treponema sp.]
MDLFDRNKMTHYPLNERSGNVAIADACICEDAWDSPISPMIEEKTKQIANEIILARRKGASVICAFGAHAIKNGLGRLMGQMLLNGWFSHTASNGTAVIHDWEFAFNGKSGEDAHATKETGLYINLALAVGAYQGLGYGASVGNMIRNNGLRIPQREELLDRGETFLGGSRNSGSMNAVLTAFDLYELIETLNIPSGFLSIPHPYSDYSLLAAERRAEHSFTCHPMFGH